MPQKLNMFLSNGNPTSSQLMAINNANKLNNAQQPNKPSTLNAPMISRVHNVKPGCSSCGRK